MPFELAKLFKTDSVSFVSPLPALKGARTWTQPHYKERLNLVCEIPTRKPKSLVVYGKRGMTPSTSQSIHC
jgi:hypothetical protein